MALKTVLETALETVSRGSQNDIERVPALQAVLETALETALEMAQQTVSSRPS